MDEEIERLIVSVRADTGAFARDVADMRGQLEGPLADGAARAGRLLEGALLKAVRTGKLGFEDLKRVALAAMAEIAAAAVRNGIGAIGAGGGGGGGGLLSLAGGLVSAILGAPGRATGGGVEPGRAYLVGERGPELFVPTSSGRIDGAAGGRARDVRLSITINTPPGEAPRALERSGRQVARAVRQALLRVED
jgi:phage-related minor tail protein